MKSIAILASGNGTNAERLIKYFENHPLARVTLVLSNLADAKVLERARNLGVESVAFSRKDFYESKNVLNVLKKHNINFVVLAGFLWLVPHYIIDSFPNKIINIHPALLPKYGGKGMYGENVHRSVIENNESESGITIHYVNREYDKGSVIFQAKCIINPNDTPESLAQKIHELEYKHFPQVIEELIKKE